MRALDVASGYRRGRAWLLSVKRAQGVDSHAGTQRTSSTPSMGSGEQWRPNHSGRISQRAGLARGAVAGYLLQRPGACASEDLAPFLRKGPRPTSFLGRRQASAGGGQPAKRVSTGHQCLSQRCCIRHSGATHTLGSTGVSRRSRQARQGWLAEGWLETLLPLLSQHRCFFQRVRRDKRRARKRTYAHQLDRLPGSAKDRTRPRRRHAGGRQLLLLGRVVRHNGRESSHKGRHLQRVARASCPVGSSHVSQQTVAGWLKWSLDGIQ
ncbi:hypothetical protein Micbo1qcDRAFT_176348 [Microdochium bolleyi]|uniref:Uncharacterized protein n=1 Tax=Microdochium bolleyi TaxID=196109 RepID=A0A136J075_9PEZI|nr:hypothetical protein Micbo1qcDRAFT_176348 [Microdochium bolleyi]